MCGLFFLKKKGAKMRGPSGSASMSRLNFIFFFCYFLKGRMTFCLPNIFEEKKLTTCRLLIVESSD